MRRRVVAAALALGLACAGKPSSAEPSPDAQAPVVAPPLLPPPAGTAAFSPDSVTPYFPPGSRAGEALARYSLEDFAAARTGFAAALEAEKDPAQQARLTYLLARCDAALQNWAAALDGFARAAPALPLLADWIAYDTARAAYFLKDEARVTAELGKIGKGSLREADGRLLAAQLVYDRSQWKDVVAAYKAYLADFPRGPRRSEARIRLAQAAEALGQKDDAIAQYRAITVESPLDSYAGVAQDRLTALVNELPKKKRAAILELTAVEHMTRGKELFEGMRNPESEAEYEAALKAPGLDDKLRCEASYYLAQSIFKRRQRMRSAPVFEATAELCLKTDNVDLQMKSVYQAGRAYQYADRGDEESTRKSIAHFARAEKLHPTHSFADDARLRQAEGWARLPRTAETDAKISELLGKLPELYPSGDMRGEALWRLAWRAWQDGKYEETIQWLDTAIATVPRDYNWWGEGQAHYWKARAYGKLGKKAEALASYQRAVREYPLAYYSLLALNRLREEWPKEFAELTAELKKPPASWHPGTAAFNFTPRAIYAEPGFARAVELLRLGLGDDAALELNRLGLRVPDGRVQVTDPDKAELLWATALLYDRARRYDKSHWIARWSVLDYKDAWPTEANKLRWQIAYPKAWWHLLSEAAKREGYPPTFFIAFVREESAFNPLTESFANAIGLTQMIKSTAERFGKGLGFPMTRENLRDPEKNVAVGSRFLAYLWKIFDHRISLIVPSYNAGEGASWRWLCERGSWAADEFNEAIPHDEARNYSKRVINSYFVYQYLEDGTIPVIPNDIPPAVINQKKCGS